MMHTLRFGGPVLAGNQIGQSGLHVLVEALRTNHSLVELDLRDCSLGITEECGSLLAEVLLMNKTLRHLDLSRNQNISDAGVSFIAKGVENNTALNILGLKACAISSEGAKYLSNAIIANRSLQVLKLGENDLTDTGICHLADALKLNHSLRELGIDKCEVTDKGLDALSSALIENASLERLDLENNHISEKGLLVMTECLKNNTSIIKLWLSKYLQSSLGNRVQEDVNVERTRNSLQLLEVKCSSCFFFCASIIYQILFLYRLWLLEDQEYKEQRLW